MSPLINLLIGAIAIIMLVVASYNYVAATLKSLAERFNLTRFIGGKPNYGTLGEIFYNYHHKSTQDWADAIILEGGKNFTIAKDQLLEHITGEPASWGAITPEAIKILAEFHDSETITALTTILKICKRIWNKYIISKQCYEAACESIIKLDPAMAKTILKEEIEQRPVDNNDITICIINSFKVFAEEEDITQLFTEILVSSKETYKSRSHAANIATSTRSKEEANKIFVESIKGFINDSTRMMSGDDNRIFEQLFNLSTTSMDENSFDLIVTCCTTTHLSTIAIRALDLILPGSITEFSPEHLYMLINLANDEQGQIANTLASIRKLTAEEKKLCFYVDNLKQDVFEKSSGAHETIKKAFAIPEGIESTYNKIEKAFGIIATQKQGTNPGAIALTGKASNEKLYLSRALAAEKKLSFVYGDYEDVVNSSMTTKRFLDEIQEHKPCLVYLDNINSLIRNYPDSFAKNFKQLLTDKSTFIIGATNEEADIAENGCSVLFTVNNELMSLFPQAVQITQPNDEEKGALLDAKLNVLQEGREKEKAEQFHILKPSNEMAPFELEKFFTKYFRASLLVFGQLIEIGEFEKLDAQNFPNRGDL